MPMETGYSGTPLPRKLGLTPDSNVLLAGAPAGFERLLEPLPDGVRLRRRAGRGLDVVVAFFTRRAELERRFDALAATLVPAGGLWIAWPKRSAGVATDLTENVVREAGLAHGLVDVKVCAIDATWSGLRFVRRRSDRV
jgi:hypothetical protein